MNKKPLLWGIVALVIALAFYLFDLSRYESVVGSVHVTIYATWFFLLLGGVMIIRFLLSLRRAS